MKKFLHPNLIRIYESEFDESNEMLQISMEYCSEGDLFQYYKKKKGFSVTEILNILKQVVQAFVVMNVKGVIHRDLKP
jgi:serine/threonine protein kinase